MICDALVAPPFPPPLNYERGEIARAGGGGSSSIDYLCGSVVVIAIANAHTPDDASDSSLLTLTYIIVITRYDFNNHT